MEGSPTAYDSHRPPHELQRGTLPSFKKRKMEAFEVTDLTEDSGDEEPKIESQNVSRQTGGRKRGKVSQFVQSVQSSRSSRSSQETQPKRADVYNFTPSMESSLPANVPRKRPSKPRKTAKDSVHTSCTISTMGFQTGAQEEGKRQRDAGGVDDAPSDDILVISSMGGRTSHTPPQQPPWASPSTNFDKLLQDSKRQKSSFHNPRTHQKHMQTHGGGQESSLWSDQNLGLTSKVSVASPSKTNKPSRPETSNGASARSTANAEGATPRTGSKLNPAKPDPGRVYSPTDLSPVEMVCYGSENSKHPVPGSAQSSATTQRRELVLSDSSEESCEHVETTSKYFDSRGGGGGKQKSSKTEEVVTPKVKVQTTTLPRHREEGTKESRPLRYYEVAEMRKSEERSSVGNIHSTDDLFSSPNASAALNSFKKTVNTFSVNDNASLRQFVAREAGKRETNTNTSRSEPPLLQSSAVSSTCTQTRATRDDSSAPVEKRSSVEIVEEKEYDLVEVEFGEEHEGSKAESPETGMPLIGGNPRERLSVDDTCSTDPRPRKNRPVNRFAVSRSAERTPYFSSTPRTGSSSSSSPCSAPSKPQIKIKLRGSLQATRSEQSSSLQTNAQSQQVVQSRPSNAARSTVGSSVCNKLSELEKAAPEHKPEPRSRHSSSEDDVIFQKEEGRKNYPLRNREAHTRNRENKEYGSDDFITARKPATKKTRLPMRGGPARSTPSSNTSSFYSSRGKPHSYGELMVQASRNQAAKEAKPKNYSDVLRAAGAGARAKPLKLKKNTAGGVRKRVSLIQPTSYYLRDMEESEQVEVEVGGVQVGRLDGVRVISSVKLDSSELRLDLDIEDKTATIKLELCDISMWKMNLSGEPMAIVLQLRPGRARKLASLLSSRHHLDSDFFSTGSSDLSEKYIVLHLPSTPPPETIVQINDILDTHLAHPQGLPVDVDKEMDPSEVSELLQSIRPSKPARSEAKPISVSDFVPTSSDPSLQLEPTQIVSRRRSTRIASKGGRGRRVEGKGAEPKRYTSTNLQKQLLIYRPEGSKVSIEMTGVELECLNPGEYLNDKVIDFFLLHLRYDTLEREQRERFHIFSSFFHSRLTDSSRDNKDLPNTPERIHDRVKTWTRHVDLFDKDIIVLPVCDRSHWFVAFICHPGQFDPETAALAAKNRAKTAAATRRRGRGRGRVSAGRRKKPKTKTPEGAIVLSGDSSQDEILLLKEEEGETPLPSQEEEEEEEERTGRSQEAQAVSESDKDMEGMDETCGEGSDMELDDGEEGEVHEERGSVEEDSGLGQGEEMGEEGSHAEGLEESPTVGGCMEWMEAGAEATEHALPLSAVEECLDSDVPGAVLQSASEGVGECGREEDAVCEDIETAPPEIEPCIVVLDSLGVRRMAIVRRLRGYLTEEWKNKRPDHPPKDFNSMRAVHPSVPLQDNSSDCGIFVLQYVENFLMSVVQGQPLLGSNEKWASYDQTRAKRANIQELILKLSEEQKKQKKS